MKTYIMFCFIDEIGGGQNYVNSKISYLEEKGWRVVVFSPKTQKVDASPWLNLNKYFENRCIELGSSPELLSHYRSKKVISWMKSVIGETDMETVIESHTDFFAEWGELLAQELQAKHWCFLLDERLELYGAKEFLYFKYTRGEAAGIHPTSLKRLFEDYRTLKGEKFPCLCAANYGVVSDVYEEKVFKLRKMDWDIAYLGRNKQYVINIVEGITRFANRYRDKKIHFLVLGDIGDGRKRMPKNVYTEELGYMNPIPRNFFSHVDVVIAGSGCAALSRREGVLTIVADASSCKSGGLLGYDTDNALFCDIEEDFDITLEKALVEETWKGKIYHQTPEFSKANVEVCYEEHFRFIKDSVQTKEYFDFTAHPQRNYSRNDKRKAYLRMYCRPIYFGARKFKEMLVNVRGGGDRS